MTDLTAYERKWLTALALLACAVLLRGWLAHVHDGMQLNAEIRIEARPSQVWDFLAQPGKRTGWHAGIVSVLPLSDNRAGMGSRSLVLYRDSGRVVELEDTVTVFTPAALWSATQEAAAFTSEIEITLTAAGEASLITFHERKFLRRFLDRYLAPWLHWKGQRRLAHSLERLKILAEREAALAIPASPQ